MTNPQDPTVSTSPDRGERVHVVSRREPALRVSWRLIGLIGIVTSIGSITALAIIASMDKAGALSTVALAIAVFSLIMQLIVSLFQFLVSQQQQASTEAFANASREALTEIRISSRDIKNALDTDITNVIKHLLGDVRKESPPEEAKIVDRLSEKLPEDIRLSPIGTSRIRNLRPL